MISIRKFVVISYSSIPSRLALPLNVRKWSLNLPLRWAQLRTLRHIPWPQLDLVPYFTVEHA